jgi:hypothetical protein
MGRSAEMNELQSASRCSFHKSCKWCRSLNKIHVSRVINSSIRDLPRIVRAVEIPGDNIEIFTNEVQQPKNRQSIEKLKMLSVFRNSMILQTLTVSNVHQVSPSSITNWSNWSNEQKESQSVDMNRTYVWMIKV